MRRAIFSRTTGRLAIALTFVGVGAAAAPLLAQTPKPRVNPRPATTLAAKRAIPRTPWGAPDLTGLWSNATTTPLERPSGVDKERLSDEEFAKVDKEVSERRNTDRAPQKGDPGTYNEVWWERGNLLKQTALIVDPPDGKVPPLTSEGQRRVSAQAQATKDRGAFDSWVDRNLHERCLLYHGVPPLPTGYNNNYQIFQTPDYVAIRYEMLAETRIIPLDKRPHLDSKMRTWMGDSRGHWEGDTLVVEVTNFNDSGGGLYELGSVSKLQGTGRTLRIVERFTRTGKGTIDYRFTIDDPMMFTRTWIGAIPLTKFEGPIYEYACHEGNYAMEHMLSGARVQEKQAKAASDAAK